MFDLAILQAEAPPVDSFVVFLAILLLVFPILFIRSLLKGWQPGSTSGLLWKALLIFSSPFYVGVVIIQVLTGTGVLDKDFGQMFPSLNNPQPEFPALGDSQINFWSEFTVGLMGAALISGIAAILIYSIFRGHETSRKKIGGLVFWGALYASAIIVANGVFDRMQEVALKGKAAETQEAAVRGKIYQTQSTKSIYDIGRNAKKFTANEPEAFNQEFREEKQESTRELGKMAKDVPDSVIFEIINLTKEQMNGLADKDKLACHYFFNTGTYLRRFRNVFVQQSETPELMALAARLEKEVLKASNISVSAAMRDQEYQSTREDLMGKVRQNLPEQNQNFVVFENPQQVVREKEKENGCLTYMAYMEEIAKLPPQDAIRYYRAVLEDHAGALNAESLLDDIPVLQNLYQDLVPFGSAIHVLFQDNPILKRDFIFFLIDEYGEDRSSIRSVALDRKKELLDINLPYYFYLATDEALHGHILYHANFLSGLEGKDDALCGRFSNALEVMNSSVASTGLFSRHERALGNLMKTTWTNQNPSPKQMLPSEYEAAKRGISKGMERLLPGETPKIGALFFQNPPRGEEGLADLCRQATAFYAELGRMPVGQAAAFTRTLMFAETPR